MVKDKDGSKYGNIDVSQDIYVMEDDSGRAVTYRKVRVSGHSFRVPVTRCAELTTRSEDYVVIFRLIKGTRERAFHACNKEMEKEEEAKEEKPSEPDPRD